MFRHTYINIKKQNDIMGTVDNYAKKAMQIIDSNSYMVVCTSDKGAMPWGAPVFFAHDRKYSKAYFISAIDSRHAKNISGNSKVALAIFDSTSPIGISEGVQIEASAEMVGKAEIDEATKIYSARLSAKSNAPEKYDPKMYLPPSEFRFFRVKFDCVYVTGEDRHIEVDLSG